MKFKKIFIYFFIIFSALISVSFATDAMPNATDDSSTNTNAVDIDVSKIAENFNKSSYVSKLSSIGINLSAVQTNNTITLYYNNVDSIVYSYDETDKLLTTYYPCNGNKNFDVLNSIFVDTISVMQGNEEGKQIPFALDDYFCYSYLRDAGIEKNYSSEDGSDIKIKFQINPFIKLSIPETDSSLSTDSYLEEYETFYTTEDCFVKGQDILFYRTFSQDGLMEIYIGQSGELNDYSYDSLLNALSVIFANGTEFSDTAPAYFKQNYENFSVGDFSFNGISVTTSTVDGLPVQNVDTILIAPNMKFAKIVIDQKIVEGELSNVNIDTPNIGDSVSVSKNVFSVPVIVALVIIGLIVIVLLFCILIRKHKNLDD